MPALDATPLGGTPPTAANFLLEVDGMSIGTFGRVGGLQLTVSVEEYAEGGVNGYVHRFPGRVQWPNLVFSRGLTESDNLLDWVKRTAGDGFEAAGGKLVVSTASVTLLDVAGTRLRSYEVEGAFPVRWTGPTLVAGDPSALTEELEVTHTGFRSSTVT
jgi:phage tail-like protein